MGKPSHNAGNESNADIGEAGNTGEQSIGKRGQDSGIGSGNSEPENVSNGSEREPESVAGKPATKKRGRKPLPRDAAGNIIRDAAAAASGRTQKAQLALNDRQVVKRNISGLHAAAATLTNQPVFALHEQEADALTNALCDVLDYHGINITNAGGVYGLYVTLGLTVFAVYKPRFDIIANGDKIVGVAPSKPTSEGEAAFSQSGMMDFSGDVGN